MELKIAAPELARALGRSQGIVEKKTTMPILSHVLLEAKGDKTLHISATDLDVSISSEHECDRREGGGARRLGQAPLRDRPLPAREGRHAQADPQQLPGDQERPLRVPDRRPLPGRLPGRCRASRRSPSSPSIPRSLLDQIDRTSFAVSSDETRYNLNGVFFEPTQGVLRLVATDGHRLSLSERAAPGDFALKRGVILPRKGLHELKKLLPRRSSRARRSRRDASASSRTPPSSAGRTSSSPCGSSRGSSPTTSR